MPVRIWRGYLLLGGGIVALNPLLPHSLWRDDVLYDLFGALSVGAVLWGIRRNRPRRRAPWLLVAAGQGAFVCGDVLFSVDDHLLGGTTFPSPADGLYLAGYPLLAAGLVLFIRGRRPGQDWPSLLDSAMVTIGVGWLAWYFLMDPYVHDRSLSGLELGFSLAYPLGDVLLLAVASRLLFANAGRSGSSVLLGTGIVSLLVADSVYGWLNLNSSYTSGAPVDVGWIASYALFGAAALHPSMAALTERIGTAEPRFTRWRLSLIAVALGVGPSMVLVRELHKGASESLAFPATGLVLAVLAVVRLGGVILRDERAVRREEALRRAVAALVQARDREAVCEAAVQAAAELGQGEDASAALALESSDGLAVVASAGPEPELFAGRALATASPNDPGASICSLVVRDRFRGVLGLRSRRRLSAQTGDALQLLAAEVSLALESQELTEEVVRRRGEERFRSLVQSSTDLIIVVDPELRVRYQTPSVQTVLDYAEQELDGEPLPTLLHADDIPRLRALVAAAVGSRQASRSVEVRILARDGAYRRFEMVANDLLADPNVNGIILTARDVTERTELEAQLRRKAFEDSLTGLPNGELFRNRLEHALERRRSGEFAVLMLDLDDFSDVNDSLGHAAGDALLADLARRISSTLRSGDTASRLGGDEFAVLLDDVDGPADALACAGRIVAALEAPFAVAGRDVRCTASIGTAVTELGESDPDHLMQQAGLAGAEAKRRGKACAVLFDPGMEAGVIDRLERVAELRRAVEGDELVVYFQPIVELRTGGVAAMEALVRWRHPERGLVPPGDFIPLAESTGLIVPLGRAVLRAACLQARAWQRRLPAGLGPLWLSVNLSVHQLGDESLVDDVRAALEESGLDPAALVLELTESVIAEDVDTVIAKLAELKKLGVRLAIDDFGSGYSALSYLRRLPVDILKIDQQFVADLERDPDQIELAKTIIRLGRILGLEVVAEGIETPEQSRRLRELECPLGQGYFYGAPVDADATAVYLDREGAARSAVA